MTEIERIGDGWLLAIPETETREKRMALMTRPLPLEVQRQRKAMRSMVGRINGLKRIGARRVAA